MLTESHSHRVSLALAFLAMFTIIGFALIGQISQPATAQLVTPTSTLRPDEIRTPLLVQDTCSPLDVVFLIDDSGSMTPAMSNVKAEAADMVSQLVVAAGGDYKMGLVTFTYSIVVRNDLAAGNASAVRSRILSLTAAGGGGPAEASDEALNTAINRLPAAGRPQTGDFNGTWRPTAAKIAILITDEPPGGFDGICTPGFDDVNAHRRALEAAQAGIMIAAIFVPHDTLSQTIDGDGPGAAPLSCNPVAVMQDYATTTNGIYRQINADGTGTGAAIQSIIAHCASLTPTPTRTPTATPTPTPTPTATPTPDVVPPSGSFTINHGALHTEAVGVRLDIVASDPGGNSVEMHLRNNDDPWSDWQPYQSLLTWQLPAINNQTHTVHMQLRDRALNMADVAPQSIFLSLYAPRPASANARLAASVWGSGALKSSPGYCLEDSTLQPFSPGLLASPTYRWYSGFWGTLHPQRVRGCGFDVNCDAAFNVLDIQLTAQHWNMILSPSCDRNAIYDFDGNLRVDVIDIQRVAAHFAP